MASTLDAIRFADCVIVMIDATAAVRETGPDHRRPDRARRPRHRLRRQQMGPDGEQGGRDLATCAKSSTGCCRRWRARRWWRSRPRTGEGLDRLVPAVDRRRQGLEHPRSHRAAQPLPGRARCSAMPPPAISGRRVRIRYMTQLKSAAAHLRAVRQPARCPARSLSALSAERLARDFRAEGHAAALGDAQYQESLRSEE